MADKTQQDARRKLQMFNKDLLCPACCDHKWIFEPDDVDIIFLYANIVKIFHKTCTETKGRKKPVIYACLQCRRSSPRKLSQVRCVCEENGNDNEIGGGCYHYDEDGDEYGEDDDDNQKRKRDRELATEGDDDDDTKKRTRKRKRDRELATEGDDDDDTEKRTRKRKRDRELATEGDDDDDTEKRTRKKKRKKKRNRKRKRKSESAKEGEKQKPKKKQFVEMDIDNYFSDKMIWPDRSRKFFLREHRKDGDGKRGLIYNALVDSKVDTNFSPLTDADIQYHFHLTSTYQGMPVSKAQDVTAVSHHIVKQGVEEQKAELDLLRNCLDETCKEVFVGLTSNQGELDKLMERMNLILEEKVKAMKRKIPRSSIINHPVDHNTVRRKYLEGKESVLQNLPVPDVMDLDGFAHIPVEQIVDHMLAHDIDLHRLQKDDDWTNEEGKYRGNYYRDLHLEVKERKKRKELPEDVVVLICRIWSDGFEAFHIKPDNDHNSLQLFTITLMEAEGSTMKKKFFTMPFALGFKKKDHSFIVNQLLMEVSEMRNVKARYCGRGKCMINTVIYLQIVMNDYPEKCANTITSQMGKYAHWFGYSCLFDKEKTPSCQQCQTRRFNKIIDKSEDNMDNSSESRVCASCDDWWSFAKAKVSAQPLQYPDDPCHPLPDDVPLVKLNFKVLMNAIDKVEDYKLRSEKPTKKTAEEYLKRCCVSTKFATFLINMIWEGVDAKTLIPEIWKMHVEYGIDLDDFATLPMHMLCLGIEKALIPQTATVFYRSVKKQNIAWKNFVLLSRKHQKELNKVHIGWCMAMPFSGKEDDKLGTANWQSEHYLAFTRLSLVHFGPLEVISESLMQEEKEIGRLFKALKAVRVLWFCLMSHMFADERVSSTVIDDYVRLFLTSCCSLYVSVKDKNGKKKGKKKKRNGKQKKSTAEDASSTDGSTGTNFVVSGCNFMSMLGAAKSIDDYGDMRSIWEGPQEGYIQHAKRELTSMRHDDRFMQTILTKLLKTSFLELLNEGNAFSQRKEYERALHVKVYPFTFLLQDMLDNTEDILSGIIVEDKMFLCYNTKERGDSGITLHELSFDDLCGDWRYNLWYARANMCVHAHEMKCSGRTELSTMASDYFVLLPMLKLESQGETDDQLTLRTVLCRSWRIRDSGGNLTLPTPHEGLLEI